MSALFRYFKCRLRHRNEIKNFIEGVVIIDGKKMMFCKKCKIMYYIPAKPKLNLNDPIDLSEL